MKLQTMKLQLTVTLLFLLPSLLQAQHKVRAQLQDATTKMPIAYASIALLQPIDSALITGVVSDERGHFELRLPDEQPYLVSVQMVGYAGMVMAVDNNIVLPEVLEMTAVSVTLQSVAVVAERSSLRTELGKRTYYIGQDLVNSGSDLSNILTQLPGTEVDVEGNISVRGNGNVLIYINGKESKRDGRSLSYLPADMIEKVELITNPSAQYDAEGVAGILNIVYRKQRSAGFNGRLTYEVGLPWRTQLGAQTNYKLRKLNAYLNANYRYSTSNNSYTGVRDNFSLNSTFKNQQAARATGDVFSLNAGVDWAIDSSTQLNLSGEYFRWASGEMVDFENQRDAQRSVFLDNFLTELEDEFELSLQWQKEFSTDEHTLNAIINYGGEIERNTEDFNRADIDLTATSLANLPTTSEVDEQQRLAALLVDYQLPLSPRQKIALGGKTQYVRYDILQQVAFANPAITLPNNDFNVTQWQHALYAVYSQQWKLLEVGLGVRFEHFQSQAAQLSIDSSFQRQATRLFPSAQVAYQLKDNQSLGLTYSKRIQRPGFFDLNPFVYYTDPLNLSTGNPFLQPELSDALEINYNIIQAQGNLNLTLFQRTTTNSIQEGIFQNGQQTVTRPINFATVKNTGVEFTWGTKLTSWWKLDVQSSWFQRTFTNDNSDLILQNRLSSWRVRLEQRFSLPKDYQL